MFDVVYRSRCDPGHGIEPTILSPFATREITIFCRYGRQYAGIYEIHILIFFVVSHRLIWDPVIGEIARYTLESGAPVPECIEKGILLANTLIIFCA